MLEIVVVLCPRIVAHLLHHYLRIISLMKKVKRLEFKIVEAKYIELRPLQKLQLNHLRKIYMYKDQ